MLCYGEHIWSVTQEDAGYSDGVSWSDVLFAFVK